MLLRAKSVLAHLRRAAVAYVVLVVALILTLLVCYYVSQKVEDSRRVDFDKTVQTAQEEINRQVVSYVDALRGARGLFYASDSIKEDEWGRYANGIELEDRYQGMQVLGYAKKVEPEERSAFDDELSRTFREEGRPDPALWPKSEERDVYFPIMYAEPLDEVNKKLLGYDAYSDPDQRATMDRARDTGNPESTGKTYLLSKAPPGSKASLALNPGIVVYLPIYRKDEPTDTVKGRRRALDGFVVGYLDAEKLLGGSFQEANDSSLDFEIYDGEKLTPNNLLYDNDKVLRAGKSQEPVGLFEAVGKFIGLPTNQPGGLPELYDLEQRNLLDREWSLYFNEPPGSESETGAWLPLFVLLSGLAVSLLLFGVTFVLIRNRLRAEKASQDLEHANRELEATNRELEAFSYSVSHDLRAPLRSIDGFSQILLEDYANELDEDGKDYLGRVRAASQRMGRLIDDILGLSRVTRGTMNRDRVDLSSLAEEVAEGLREGRPEREVKFSIQKGLKVWGDSRLLRVALENLIGNAWKFTGKEPEARIEFGVDEELSRRGRIPVYYVRDNGAGFEMAYANKLFGAFQRLHGSDEFEGTGIGLATVQRIVHRHGGRIWAKGETGRGATFYFTLRPGLGLDPGAPRKEEVKAK
jgi:signal transduction histidine kinase/sensor domain CHASE-containing protein